MISRFDKHLATGLLILVCPACTFVSGAATITGAMDMQIYQRSTKTAGDISLTFSENSGTLTAALTGSGVLG